MNGYSEEQYALAEGLANEQHKLSIAVSQVAVMLDDRPQVVEDIALGDTGAKELVRMLEESGMAEPAYDEDALISVVKSAVIQFRDEVSN